MLRGLIVYLLAFAIGFPPGSLPKAMAEETDPAPRGSFPVNSEKLKKHEKLISEISGASMDLTSMLMQQRFPGSKPLSFQKTPSLANLTQIQHTMNQWRDKLKADWEDLLLNTQPMTDEGLQKMVAQTEALSLEVILYFQAQYLYLANLSFLSPQNAEQIQLLIKNTQVQIPLENIMNHQLYVSIVQKLLQSVPDVIDAGLAKTMNMTIDQCAGHMNCLSFSLSSAKAYRALEAVSQYKEDNDSFQHFTRLLILENYVGSYAKLDYYLNPQQNTLKLPEELLKQHPSLPFLYQEIKSGMENTKNFRFVDWLGADGKDQLEKLFDELNQDPDANMVNEAFLKKYRAILKAKVADSPVLENGRLDYLREITKGAYIAKNIVNFAYVAETLDENKKFKTDVWLNLFLLNKNIYMQSELLSDPLLSDAEKLSIHELIKSELIAIKKRIDVQKYQTKIAALYSDFQKSLKNEIHENVTRDIYHTAEQINAVKGLDYQSLIIAMQQTGSFRKLRVSEALVKILNSIAENFKDGITEDHNQINDMQVKFATSYYATLFRLINFWVLLAKPKQKILTLKELADAVDLEQTSVRGHYLDKNVSAIEKDLHDWLKIGAMFHVHDSSEMISEALQHALTDTEQQPTIKAAFSINTYPLDANGLSAYQELMENSLASRFPLLTAKISTTKIMKGMESDRKEYDVPVTLPEQALWKHLKNKTYEESLPLITEQLKTTRAYVQKQINSLAAEVNASTSILMKVKTSLGMSRFDELNGQIPEVLSLHLAYSTVLDTELKGYGMKERLNKFRQQYKGKSDFQLALDRVIEYTSYYYYAMIFVQVANLAAFSRISFLNKFAKYIAPWSAPGSAAFKRDGLNAAMAKWRGQPITLFGVPQSWLDLGFFGGLLFSAGITFTNAMDTTLTDVPFLEKAFPNQVSCSKSSTYALYSDEGCQIGDKDIITATKETANQEMQTAGITAVVVGGMLYGLPKTIAFAQKYMTRASANKSKNYHEILEKLLQDVGFSQGTRVSFSTKDIRDVTYNILKEFYQKSGAATSSARRDLPERIFILTRYLQLQNLIRTEISFLQKIERALTPHWQRLGITPESADWIRRFDPRLIQTKMQDIRINNSRGSISPRQYESLTQDVQIISGTLQPVWNVLIAASKGQIGNYGGLVRFAMETRLGTAQGLPTVPYYEVATSRAYSALYVRAEMNGKNQVTIVRRMPYELNDEAKALIDKVKNGQVNGLLKRRSEIRKKFEL